MLVAQHTYSTQWSEQVCTSILTYIENVRHTYTCMYILYMYNHYHNKPSMTLRGCRSTGALVSMWNIFWAFQINRFIFTGSATWRQTTLNVTCPIIDSFMAYFTVSGREDEPERLPVFLQLFKLTVQFILGISGGHYVSDNLILVGTPQLPIHNKQDNMKTHKARHSLCINHAAKQAEL